MTVTFTVASGLDRPLAADKKVIIAAIERALSPDHEDRRIRVRSLELQQRRGRATSCSSS